MIEKTLAGIFFICILILLFLTLLFSVLTFVTIIHHWRVRCRSIINLLTCNSCVAQIFFVIASSSQIPSVIQQIYAGKASEPDRIVCKIYASLITIGTAIVSNSCLIQAISRFLITILFQYKFLSTFSMNWILIMTSWLESIIAAIILCFIPSAYQFEPETYTCTPTTKHFSTAFTLSVINILVTIVTVISLYGVILYQTTRPHLSQPRRLTTLRIRRNQKVFRNVFIFIIILTSGGIPYLICTITNSIREAPRSLYLVSIFFVTFAITMNSIALLITNNQVKQILLKKFIYRQRNRILPYSV